MSPHRSHFRITLSLSALICLSGCASTDFSVVGNDEYRVQKVSDGCSVASSNWALTDLRAKALKFCAGRKETPQETAVETVTAIPFIRCASAALTFRCEGQAK